MSFAILLELVCYVYPPETKETERKGGRGHVEMSYII